MSYKKVGDYYLQILKFLKGDSPKNENCHRLLNMSFQTCMKFFLLWSIIWEIQEMFVHTVEIKGNQNGLVTFYKIFFYVQQKKGIWNNMRVRKDDRIYQQWLSSSLAQNQCFAVKCFSMWQKCIITFVAFVVNSVKSISICSCHVSCFIY